MKKYICISIAATCIAIWGSDSTSAQEAGNYSTVGYIHGKCEKLVLAGNLGGCSEKNRVLYARLPNGKVVLTVERGIGRLVSFVGEKDSQPQPESYYLYLSRVRTASKGTESSSNVAGQCIVRMSRDGSVWFRVDCDATDEDGAPYTLRFRSDGKPIAFHSQDGLKSPQAATRKVDEATVADVGALFVSTLKKSGMLSVVTSIQTCFDDAVTRDTIAIRRCMLYDIAAYKFDRTMREVFVARGWSRHIIDIPFLSKEAFNARMTIYSAFDFGSSHEAVYEYFGDAPDRIVRMAGD